METKNAILKNVGSLTPAVVLTVAATLSESGFGRVFIAHPATSKETIKAFLGEDVEEFNMQKIACENNLALEGVPSYAWKNLGGKKETTLIVAALNDFAMYGDETPAGWTSEALRTTGIVLPWIGAQFPAEAISFVEDIEIGFNPNQVLTDTITEIQENPGISVAYKIASDLAIDSAKVEVFQSGATDGPKKFRQIIVVDETTSSLAKTMTSVKKRATKSTVDTFILVKTSEGQYTFAFVSPEGYTATKPKGDLVETPEAIKTLTKGLDEQVTPFEASGNTLVFTGEVETIIDAVTTILDGVGAETRVGTEA